MQIGDGKSLFSKMTRMNAIQIDINERNRLATTGYYSRVKHVLDRYEREGKYLVHSEIFPNEIILYHWPIDDHRYGSDVVHLY